MTAGYRADVPDGVVLEMIRLRASGLQAGEVGQRFGVPASMVRSATNRVFIADMDHCGAVDAQARGRARDVVGACW